MTPEEFAKLRFASGVRKPLFKGVNYEHWGKIECVRSTKTGIDENLWAILVHYVDSKSVHVVINSVDTGEHAPNSRHYDGRAVDIGAIYKVGGRRATATVKNREAIALVQYLFQKGWAAGERVHGRAVPGILVGPAKSPYNPTTIPHERHLHISIVKPPKP